MAVKTLLGTLVKKYPHYTQLLMKPHEYQEVFGMNHNHHEWTGMIQFIKKTGTEHDGYDKYIVSVITINNHHTTYEECIKYFLTPLTFSPVITIPTWRKNKIEIPSKKIPSELFALLEKKHPADILYSSHPI
jgi:hypothetical protein